MTRMQRPHPRAAAVGRVTGGAKNVERQR
jgi:hypothetical protein